ncbi:MAG: thioredoxin [Methanofollis liminatans]|jgi:thioredoxin 1|uniref:Thioredoxin n=1 Tax=Methanofollis liminatans DSM 4140 TaxID=28892 RepID=J1AT28_9EURY|nr:thioredoxin [Methanofollis liminatans]EJG08243.1 thioredoxin [Methanofollis liminatans DSM 4140]MDD3111363.1 thioredoxin [Methanofollis liminatans]
MDDELERIRERKRLELASRFSAMKDGVIEISDHGFAGAIAAHRYLVVDFWAEWCGPCQRVAPEIEALALEFAGQVAFGKCNVDENPKTSASFGVEVIPTLVFFSNGRPVGRLTGALPRETLRSQVKRAFGLSE